MMISGSDDRRMNEGRLTALRVFFVVCCSTLAIGFWLLQVVQHQKYVELADNNHLKTIPLRAPRGVLFDRNSRVLVENTNSFTIAIVREQSRNLDRTVGRLAEITGVDEARIREIVQRRRREPSFRPIAVIEHATFAQVAAVTAHRLEMPEIEVQQVPTRTYPNAFGSHLFGYVGEIQESQLASPEFAAASLQAGAIVGQAGLEKAYNADLMGVDGNKFVAVNSVGREIDQLERQNPVEGKRLQLSIDYDIQRALEEAFRAKDSVGAAVILDPRTGEILGMTSQPGYDPNDFAVGIDRTKWTSLTTDPDKPLRNRAIQDRFSPGSTFKIVMATAALSEGIITPDYRVYCPGSITLYGHTFRCDKREGHGSLDLRHALEQSCDVYFYKLGSMMSVDTIHKYGEEFGLVGKTGVDLPNEVDSLVPSTEWKLKTTGDRWYPGETISVAIGQGQVTVTPIALATMISTVANGGTVVTPHLVKAIDEGQGWQNVAVPKPRSQVSFPLEILSAVRDGLWLAVNGAGTGFRAKMAGYDVVGKTGTAQVASLEKAEAAARAGLGHLRDNAWFVFYAPRDKPEIAGVVFVQRGGFGAMSSAPIARYVLETYFAKREGRPLPTVRVGGDGVLVTEYPKAAPPQGEPPVNPAAPPASPARSAAALPARTDTAVR
jgi:penicillin-binding protein 2